MQQIYPDEGLEEQLRRIVADGVTFHLYTNSVSLSRDTELTDLTEAAWSGYAPVVLGESDFASTGVVGHVGFAMAPPIAFLNSSGSPVDAYGYFVTNDDDDLLLAIAAFDGGPIEKEDGESFVVTPVWGDFSAAIGE
jgi:hypothetical protein